MNGRLCRIVLYIKALSLENSRSFLAYHVLAGLLFVFIAALWGVAIRAFLFVTQSLNFFALLQSIYFLFLFVSVYMSIGRSFRAFHFKQTAVQAWAVPASSFEKYCAVFLYYFFFHIVLTAIIAFVAANGMFVAARIITHGFSIAVGWSVYADIFSSVYINFVRNFAAAFGYFFCGAVLFRRNQFLKTVVCIGFISAVAVTIILAVKMFRVFTLVSANTGEYINIRMHGYDPAALYFVLAGSVLALVIGYFRFSRMQAVV